MCFDILERSVDSPMTVVTAGNGGERSGCLVGFWTQCSIEPLRCVIMLSKSNHTSRVARFAPTLAVQCGRHLTDTAVYPPGSRFLVSAKLTDRLGGEPFLYVYHGDPVVVLTAAEAKKFLAEFRRGRI